MLCCCQEHRFAEEYIAWLSLSTRRSFEFITVYGLWYAVSPLKGGTPYGQCTIYRCAGPSRRVPGFHQPDPRRVSATASAFRGRVPSAYGSMVPGWQTAHRVPVCRLQKLSPADARRSALFYSGLRENLLTAGRPGTSVRHGPEQ